MPGRDRYSPDTVPVSISGITEIIFPGNVAGDDDNWQIDISSGDWIIYKKVGGTWTKAYTIKGS